MEDSAIERAKERVEQRAEGAATAAVLARAREQVEMLAATAADLEASLPGRVETAVQEGIREQVLPVGRNLAEIRGLMNRVLRRLERLEGDVEAERHARVDDLALLVELIGSGWKSVDARLGRVESVLARLEQVMHERTRGATIYRLEDRRPDGAAF